MQGPAWPTYREGAARLLDMGYAPVPVKPGTKEACATAWSTVPIDERQMDAWTRQYPGHGIGLRTGALVGLDIDCLDPDRAHGLQALAFARFGPTLIRVGCWPKRLLLFRTDAPFAKITSAGLEVLAQGQQFVAFGLHPVTRQPYHWPLGETPFDVALADLPPIDRAGAEAWLGEAAALFPSPATGSRAAGGRRVRRTGAPVNGAGGGAVTRDAAGRVVDGRDAWLSTVAYHAVQDDLAEGAALDVARLTARVWDRFTATTDLSRPRQDGAGPYTLQDAARKVGDKLRLQADGRLPPLVLPDAVPVVVAPGLPLAESRARLDTILGDVCARVADWHRAAAKGAPEDTPPPRLGIRATVGLGKTAASRRHLLALRATLQAAGLPHRIFVVTPSHALAEESAAAWAEAGVAVAVHRGYEAQHPTNKAPMCRDLPMVRMAVTAGLSVYPNACLRRGGSKCHAFDGCLKQANRCEVEAAEVVVAAYDVLFTAPPVPAESLAVVVIDEGCWARALHESRGLAVETLDVDAIIYPQRLDDPAEEEAAWTTLMAARRDLRQALARCPPGAVRRSHLLAAGQTAELCLTGAEAEVRLRPDPGLRPGLTKGERAKAAALAQAARLSLAREALFRALARLLGHPDVAAGEDDTAADADGRVRLLPPDPKTGLRGIVMTRVQALHPALAARPILRLDATLRSVLAETVLPGLEVVAVEASTPHMSLTLVAGRFGKSSLCPDPRADAAETRRRARRLAECVDHVRWEARRVAPGRVLVVTYKDCEAAFAGIPGVATAHFNAIAGLDVYGDVALLVVIGRALPPSQALPPMAGGYFGVEPEGGYASTLRGVLMRDGARRTVRVTQHADVHAETLRAAICDDEVIQAMGRGRGVNRTAANPLEVQVLADVALALVHDAVVRWETRLPDLLQRMLLAGVAVDSPGDAAMLHPALFGNPGQATMAFEREGFNQHSPIENSYRGMLVKSFRYRRIGRGRGWQTAWWIEGSADDARAVLTRALGSLSGWAPVL